MMRSMDDASSFASSSAAFAAAMPSVAVVSTSALVTTRSGKKDPQPRTMERTHFAKSNPFGPQPFRAHHRLANLGDELVTRHVIGEIDGAGERRRVGTPMAFDDNALKAKK